MRGGEWVCLLMLLWYVTSHTPTVRSLESSACFHFICAKWDERCHNFDAIGPPLCHAHQRFLDLLHKEMCFHAKLTHTGVQYLQMTLCSSHKFLIWGIWLYTAELQRYKHLKDDPEFYSRAVSSLWIACGTQDGCDPFLNGLLSSPRVSGDAPLLKHRCRALQCGDDWYALMQNSTRWTACSGVVVDGIDGC